MEHSVPFAKLSSMRQDAADKRNALIAAARQLFLSEGAGVSMRAIAKSASVGVATAARHFPERIDLLDAVSAQAVDEITEVVEQHLANSDLDPRSTWRATVHAIAELELAALAQAIFTDTMQLPDASTQRQRIMENRIADIRKVYEQLLAPAKRAGLCPADVDPLDFDLALGIVTRPLPVDAPELPTRTPMRNRLIDVMLDGLEAQANAAE